MAVIFRKSLVMLLAMLQFFAPLVHAHSGNSSFSHGLHIPGLESYAYVQDAIDAPDVNAGIHAEGLLIVMDAGIKNPQDSFAETGRPDIVYLPSSQLFRHRSPDRPSNYAPLERPVFVRRLTNSLCVRAPPQ